MPEPFKKVRYPAHLVKHLKKYPVRHCTNPLCGRQLTPKVFASGLEPLNQFRARATCGVACRDEKRAAERERKKTEAEAKTSPSAETVQDAEKEPGGLETNETPEDSPPEPPTLTDPAYGGPPAPEEVAKPVMIAEKPSKPEPGEPERSNATSALHSALDKLNPAQRRASKPKKEPATSAPTRSTVEEGPAEHFELAPPPSEQRKLPDPRPKGRTLIGDEKLRGTEVPLPTKRSKVDAPVVNLLEQERERAARLGVELAPPGVIEIDPPLRRALRAALLHHDPDFIQAFESLEQNRPEEPLEPLEHEPYPEMIEA